MSVVDHERGRSSTVNLLSSLVPAAGVCGDEPSGRPKIVTSEFALLSPRASDLDRNARRNSSLASRPANGELKMAKSIRRQ